MEPPVVFQLVTTEAKPVAGRALIAAPVVCEGLGGSHLEHRHLALASWVAEDAVTHVVGPVVLRFPEPGQPMQPALVADLNGVAFDDEVEALPEVVAAGREDAMRVALDVPLLLLALAGAEVKRAIEPDRDERCDVRSSVCAHR